MESAEGSAPGRVNIVGEHTDYNGGLVLPTVIPQRTTVRVRRREDARITLRSGAEAPVELDADDLRPRGAWSDYVSGIVATLRTRGHAVGGFDAEVSSRVPAGAGLASSAALLVATARALGAAFSLALDDVEVAGLAYAAETAFVGARVGRMDQLVCALGREGEALYIDMRDGAMRHVPLAGVPAEIAVVDSGIRHAHASGSYNVRRAECEEAARLLGVASLRDVPAGARLDALPPTLARRARHVVSENRRVTEAVSAIEAGDARALGRIVSASHDSLRDDFAVSTPEIDALVDAARAFTDCYGARLTGGGFGGSVLLLTRPGTARRVGSAAVAGTPATLVLPR